MARNNRNGYADVRNGTATPTADPPAAAAAGLGTVVVNGKRVVRMTAQDAAALAKLAKRGFKYKRTDKDGVLRTVNIAAPCPDLRPEALAQEVVKVGVKAPGKVATPDELGAVENAGTRTYTLEPGENAGTAFMLDFGYAAEEIVEG